MYIQVLQELKEAGVQWVQLDEPIFGTNLTEADLVQIKEAYATIAQAVPGIKIIVQTYFESVDFYEEIVNLPVAGVGLDFVHGDALYSLRQYGFPKDKVLAAGVIDGRNVWRHNLDNKLGLLETIQQLVDKERIIVQPSSSLLHVPVTKKTEPSLDPIIKDALSFADEKLEEVVSLAKALENGKDTIVKELEDSVRAIETLNNSKYRKKTANQIDASELHVDRALPFAQRISIQKEILQLPLLPTTTIGSLPQTTVVRQQRLKWRKGDITDREYEQYIEKETEKWIKIQEDIGLDVLVHGEFERTDMVEYFGEKLNGFPSNEVRMGSVIWIALRKTTIDFW